MFLCSKLLLAMVESVDINFKWSIMSEMVPELSLNHLKKKMVDVFLYKIGGDEKKLRIYYSDKVSQSHYKILMKLKMRIPSFKEQTF